MSFDPDFLRQQLAKIKAMQDDVNFLIRKAEKATAVKPKASKQSLQKSVAEAAAKKLADELKRKAKEVIKARKIKKLETHVAYGEVDRPGQGFVKKAAIEKVYKTRQQNMAELVAVRVDAKTTIYVRPGKNIDEVIRKYQERKQINEDSIGPETRDVNPDKFAKKPNFQLKVLKPVDNSRFNDLLDVAERLCRRAAIRSLDVIYDKLAKYVGGDDVYKRCKVVKHQENKVTWVVCLEYGDTDRANATITEG